MGYEISLRRQEAEMIEIISEQEAKEQAVPVSYTHLAHQEFVVVFGLLQTVFYEVHGFYRIHVGKVLAENPHAVQCLLVLQQMCIRDRL